MAVKRRLLALLACITLWSAANKAPVGHVSRWVTLWSVLFFSTMVLYATVRMFSSNPPDIGMGAATAYGSLLASGLAGAWAVFRWARGDKDAPYGTDDKPRGGFPWTGG